MFAEVCTYDRKAKTYILRPNDNEAYEFPSGPKGKMEAYQFWLSLEYSSIHSRAVELSKSNAHAERTIWKAAEIAVTPGMIDPVNNNELIAMVQSASDPYGRYLVSADTMPTSIEQDQLLCNCPAFQELTAVYIFIDNGMTQVCKHSLAVWLNSQIKTEE
jgi:hypothetical protein